MGRKTFLFFAFAVFLIALDCSLGLETNCTVNFESNLSIGTVENNLSISPSNYTILCPDGDNVTFFFNLSADLPGNSGLNVTVSREGTISSWISFGGANESDIFIPAGEFREINLTVSVPASTGEGIYIANITANSSTGQARKLNLTVNVTDSVGRISVTVSDILSPIEGASVFVWAEDSSLKDTGTTDSNGHFLSEWLLSGNYTVEATKAGYSLEKENTTVGGMGTSEVQLVLEPTGAPFLHVSPNSISESGYTGDRISRTLILSNIGDMVLSNVVLSSDSGWISFSQNSVASIPGGEDRTVTAYLGPISSSGSYSGKIFVNSSNNGNRQILVAFDVNSPPEEPRYGGGISFEPPPGNQTTEPVVRVEIVGFQPEVNASLGESKVVSIQVKNTGDAVVSNLTLRAVSIFSVGIFPETTTIEPNSSKIFLATVEIPLGANYGKYNIVFVLSAEGVYSVQTVGVNVVESTPFSSFDKRLQETEELLESIWNFIIETEGFGYNLIEAKRIYSETNATFLEAEECLASGDFSCVDSRIALIRSDIQSVLEYIEAVTSAKFDEREPVQGYNLILLVVVVLFLLILIFATYMAIPYARWAKILLAILVMLLLYISYSSISKLG